jgi:hypothetical protein
MRLQLAFGALLLVAGTAHADGTVTARGAYYKERATRVVQPMLDSMFEVGARGLVDAHFLVDAITSASTSSGSVGAEPFTENRYEAGGGYTHNLGAVRVNGAARYSTESDYDSIFGGLRGEADLNDKATTLGIGFGYAHDTISGGPSSGLGTLMLKCDALSDPALASSRTLTCNLDTYSVFASASQIVNKNLVVGASVDVAWLRGYQSNPYRQAVVGNMTEPEQHPNKRTRQAYAVYGRYFVEPSKTTIIGIYRYYRDNWLETDAIGAGAHTPEVRIVQELGDTVDASIRYRYHTQNGADFYQERYAMAQTFRSDDVKLSDFSTHLIEGKLGLYGETFGLEDTWGGMRIEALLQYFIQHNRFGNGISAQLALTVPFEY